MPPDQTQKFRKLFIAMLILAIVFFLGSGILGYLYYQKYQSYKNLSQEQQLLQNQLKEAATGQGLTAKQIADLQKENTDLKSANTTQTQKMAKAKAYNAVLAYIVQIVQAHDGLNGWTEAEYQTGRTLATKTNDNDFIALIDWAWTNTTLDQVERLSKVLDSIANNIGNNVK